MFSFFFASIPFLFEILIPPLLILFSFRLEVGTIEISMSTCAKFFTRHIFIADPFSKNPRFYLNNERHGDLGNSLFFFPVFFFYTGKLRRALKKLLFFNYIFSLVLYHFDWSLITLSIWKYFSINITPLFGFGLLWDFEFKVVRICMAR